MAASTLWNPQLNTQPLLAKGLPSREATLSDSEGPYDIRRMSNN